MWNLLSPLFSFLRQQFEKSQQLSVFEKCCLDNPEKLGIVISERVMNLPPELSPWLQQALLDEVEWATEDEPTEQRRAMFALEYFLYITQVYLDSDRPKKKRKSSIHNPSSTENILFIKAEDSSYFVHQTSWCLWPISSKQQQQVEDSLEKQKMAMILSKDQMIEAKNDIQKQIV